MHFRNEAVRSHTSLYEFVLANIVMLLLSSIINMRNLGNNVNGFSFFKIKSYKTFPLLQVFYSTRRLV